MYDDKIDEIGQAYRHKESNEGGYSRQNIVRGLLIMVMGISCA
jgi:hypothetical protein